VRRRSVVDAGPLIARGATGAVDPLDGHITAHPVEETVLADTEPVVLAGVERVWGIRVTGQGINRGSERSAA
jgi:hypothetical protein